MTETCLKVKSAGYQVTRSLISKKENKYILSRKDDPSIFFSFFKETSKSSSITNKRKETSNYFNPVEFIKIV